MTPDNLGINGQKDASSHGVRLSEQHEYFPNPLCKERFLGSA
jgi:hypothetical protein